MSLCRHLISPETSLLALIKWGSRWRLGPNFRPLTPLDNCAWTFKAWPYVYVIPGSHRLEKYLNLEGFFKSPWKLNLPWKVLENHSKALKSPWILLFSVGLNSVDRDLNQYKIDVPLFSAAYAAPNIGTTILYYCNFPVLMSPLSSIISEVDF